MAEATTLTDPTDWKGTSLQALEHLDAALRCEVCKEFYNAPMITHCCHTFCSLCIRRAFHRDGKCPICRAQSQEFNLRKNTTVQDALDAFVGCRQHLLELATKAKVPERAVEQEVEAEDGDIEMSSQRSRRSQRNRPPPQPQHPKRTVVECSEDDDDAYRDSPSPPPDDGLVPCPICQKRMKEASINAHLDQSHFSDDKKRSTPPLTSSQPLAPANRPARTTNTRSATAVPEDIEPLPKLTYNFLSEKKLRQKLRELGIPDHGSRKLLQERHTEWTSIYNANRDATPLSRKSKKELLKGLATWETAHTRPANDKSKAPDWSAKEWAKTHDEDFLSLIEQARENVKRQKVEKGEEKGEEKEKGETGGGEDDKPSPVKPMEKPPSPEPFGWTNTGDSSSQVGRYAVHQVAVSSSGSFPQHSPQFPAGSFPQRSPQFPAGSYSQRSPQFPAGSSIVNRYPASQPPAVDLTGPIQPMLRPQDPESTAQQDHPYLHSAFPVYGQPPSVETGRLPPPLPSPLSSSQPTEGKRKYSSIEESTLTGTT